jgi:hypothetical protein
MVGWRGFRSGLAGGCGEGGLCERRGGGVRRHVWVSGVALWEREDTEDGLV